MTGTGQGAWRALHALLPALAGAALAGWAVLPPAAVAAAAALAGLAGWALQPASPFSLRWDGEHWQVDGLPGGADVMIDLGAWMLLRHRASAGGVRWLALSRADAGPAWPALRAALYAQ